MPNRPRKPSGFAALSAEQRREIAQRGGRAAQAKVTGQKFNHEKDLRLKLWRSLGSFQHRSGTLLFDKGPAWRVR
jgi:hypothetical protein